VCPGLVTWIANPLDCFVIHPVDSYPALSDFSAVSSIKYPLYVTFASTSSPLHTNSETVCFLALAAISIVRKSSRVKRTGTIRPLASPFGSFGRPTFLGFFCRAKVPELLNNRRSDCRLRRTLRGDCEEL